MERLDTLLKVVWCWSHRSKQNLFVSEKRYDKLSLAFPIPNLHALHYQYVINDKFILNLFFFNNFPGEEAVLAPVFNTCHAVNK